MLVLETVPVLAQSVKQLVEKLERDDGPLNQLLAQLRATGISLERTIEGAQVEETMESVREASEAIRALADMLERDPGALLRGKVSDDHQSGRAQ